MPDIIERLEEIMDVLRYDELSGNFFWRRTKGKAKEGAIAGHISKGKPGSLGYRTIGINGVHYAAHRLVWLLFHGEIPKGMQIDHIDGNGLNNRLNNLRLADQYINSQNQNRAHRRNSCGLLGVSYKNDTFRRKRWHAKIYANGKKIDLGYHETKEQAHSAYVAAKRVLHQGCAI